MSRWRGAVIAVACALSLSACVTDDYYYEDTTVYGGYGGYAPGYPSPPPTYRDGWGRPDPFDPRWGSPPPAYGYRPPPVYAPAPSYGYSGGLGLNDVQENALLDGCRARYSGNARKLRACVNGGANAGAALAQGCEIRYAGNPKKYRRCMGF